MIAPVQAQRAIASTRPFSPARLAIAGGAAAVLNLGVYFIASAGGASMAVSSPSYTEIPAVLAIFATVISIAVAGIVTWFIARRRARFRTVAAWLGLGVALVSVPSPLMVSEDLATGLALATMHLVAGIAWFVGLRGTRESR